MLKDVISSLQEASDFYKKNQSEENDKFRSRAYYNAARNLEKTYGISKTNILPDDLDDIQGIGHSLKEKLTALITSNVPLYPKKEDNVDTDDLQDIHGIGPVMAKRLKLMGINKSNINEHMDLLNSAQKIGVTYMKDFEKKIPQKEMKQHDSILTQVTNKYYFECSIVGSYRRELPYSGDIDMLIKSDSSQDLDTRFRSMVEDLKNMKYIVSTLAMGTKKFMGVCRINNAPYRRLDILLVSAQQYPFSLLYFTGSKEFNIMMRSHALSKGYSLNEYGLTPMHKSIKTPNNIKTEEDIFKFLDLPYKHPKYRT